MFHYTQSAWAGARRSIASEPTPASCYPFRQGSLDALCGIYAATNAVGLLLSACGLADGKKLFRQHLNCAIQYQSLDSIVLDGIDDRLMGKLLKEIAVKEYGLTVKRPFYHHQPRLTRIWQQLREHTGGGGVAIMREARHWSVIDRVTTTRLQLKDSLPEGMSVRYRTVSAAERWGFEPRHLYCLARSQEGIQ